MKIKDKNDEIYSSTIEKEKNQKVKIIFRMISNHRTHLNIQFHFEIILNKKKEKLQSCL